MLTVYVDGRCYSHTQFPRSPLETPGTMNPPGYITTTTTTTTLYFTPNIQEIKIYNNSTDNDRGAGCPK